MKKFPDVIPIFPLSGVIYFPKTNLPLNIFEQRYVNLVNDAYNKDKLMVQSQIGLAVDYLNSLISCKSF